jgi:hypothetical protein
MSVIKSEDERHIQPNFIKRNVSTDSAAKKRDSKAIVNWLQLQVSKEKTFSVCRWLKFIWTRQELLFKWIDSEKSVTTFKVTINWTPSFSAETILTILLIFCGETTYVPQTAWNY